MEHNCAVFKNVSRKVFDEVSDKMRHDPETRVPINIYYNGTDRRGTLTIEASPGHNHEYKKALRYVYDAFANE